MSANKIKRMGFLAVASGDSMIKTVGGFIDFETLDMAASLMSVQRRIVAEGLLQSDMMSLTIVIAPAEEAENEKKEGKS